MHAFEVQESGWSNTVRPSHFSFAFSPRTRRPVLFLLVSLTCLRPVVSVSLDLKRWHVVLCYGSTCGPSQHKYPKKKKNSPRSAKWIYRSVMHQKLGRMHTTPLCTALWVIFAAQSAVTPWDRAAVQHLILSNGTQSKTHTHTHSQDWMCTI